MTGRPPWSRSFLHEMFLDNPFYRGDPHRGDHPQPQVQGVWAPHLQKITSLPERVFTPGRMEFHKDANMLKGGLVYADRITTVSPTYVRGDQNALLRRSSTGCCALRAVTFGGSSTGSTMESITRDRPSSMPPTARTISAPARKAQNKRRLQAELGLPQDPDAMMIGMITRLTDQKGLDLLAYVIERLLLGQVQLAVIGTGDAKYESMLRHFEWTRKDKGVASIMFDDTRAPALRRVGRKFDALALRALRPDPADRPALRQPAHRAGDRRAQGHRTPV